MNIDIGNKVLITTDNWFLAPDGEEYRAVFGILKGAYLTEKTFGIRPNGRSTNWYIEVGNVTLAGCQIHYCIKTDNCSQNKQTNWNSDSKGNYAEHRTPSKIYFAE